jgi:hypothetical protein
VPIKGNLDKIEFDGKNVTVVDYKTGRVRNAKDELQHPTNDDNPMAATTGARPYFTRSWLITTVPTIGKW